MLQEPVLSLGGFERYFERRFERLQTIELRLLSL